MLVMIIIRWAWYADRYTVDDDDASIACSNDMMIYPSIMSLYIYSYLTNYIDMHVLLVVIMIYVYWSLYSLAIFIYLYKLIDETLPITYAIFSQWCYSTWYILIACSC